MDLYLPRRAVRISTGTIVDATIIEAPSSTKNRDQQRDPEMRQTKKGNQWHFGMKAHLGVDSKFKIVHTAVATAANLADSTVLRELLHGDETRIWDEQVAAGTVVAVPQAEPDEQHCRPDSGHQPKRISRGAFLNVMMRPTSRKLQSPVKQYSSTYLRHALSRVETTAL